MTRFVSFGETMLRLSPSGQLRLPQAIPGRLEVTLAGAELNVASSLAMLGAEARYVTALPRGPLGDTVVSALRALGIDTGPISRVEQGRLGLVFVENGANQRPSRVVYDRQGSAMSLTPAATYDWKTIFSGADWLHVTGITPALSECAARATLEAVRGGQAAGLTVSCDLNFRSKLWRWDTEQSPRALARHVMCEILPHVDLLVTNEEDCGNVLDIYPEMDAEGGPLDATAYPDLARQVVERFPNLRMVATTLRESLSASHNNWGAMLYDAATDRACFAPQQEGNYRPYEIHNLVDRVGGGDAFAAGLMFGLSSVKYARPEAAVAFAVAASCLAHSISGDINYSSLEEVEALLSGEIAGRVVR